MQTITPPPRSRRIKPWLLILLALLVVGGIVGGYVIYRYLLPRLGRWSNYGAWVQNPDSHPEWMNQAGQICGDAPFAFPTDGVIFGLWDDSWRPGHRHQGLDIFAGTEVGVTPVYAAYPGYLTRMPDWISTVIIRIPDDPLQPGRQIWTYYTHMADVEGNSFVAVTFPPGTTEVYVEAGTLLGYQGNYSGDPGNPTGLHLHFSIVKDDGEGNFLNELKINNTIDPSPYFNLPVNAKKNRDELPVCGEAVRFGEGFERGEGNQATR